MMRLESIPRGAGELGPGMCKSGAVRAGEEEGQIFENDREKKDSMRGVVQRKVSSPRDRVRIA